MTGSGSTPEFGKAMGRGEKENKNITNRMLNGERYQFSLLPLAPHCAEIIKTYRTSFA